MCCRSSFIAVCLLASPSFSQAADVSAVVEKDGIEFRSGSTVVAKYVTDPKYAKPFLYPLLAPNGVPVTRGWPIVKGAPGDVTTDHVHQKSVWFCHGDVIPEGFELKVKTTDRHGRGVDFWSEAKDKDGTRRHGQMTVVKVAAPKSIAKDHVSVETRNEWKTPDGVKILDEVRVIHFIDRPEGRLFGFEITLQATVCQIAFGDTKEGSFGIRTHDALRPNQKDGATITTAEGKSIVPGVKKLMDDLPIWGHPAAWIDYSGRINGKEVGVAVFDHPSNPSANWHVRVYGLNAANPFGREHSGFPTQKGKTELFRIEKGGDLKLRYAVYAHTGDAKGGRVAEAYEEFKK
jgi:methane monooxygenase PmoA-like